MKVLELIETDRIDDTLKGLLPTKCINATCDGDMMINDTLTQMWCSNPDCPTLKARNLEAMLKTFKVKNFGPGVCQDIVDENDMENIYDIFSYEPENMPSKYGFDYRCELISEIYNIGPQPLYLIVESLHLSGISGTAKKLFSGYDDIEEFFNDLDGCGEEMLADLLQHSVGQRTSDLMSTLYANKEYIEGAVEIIGVQPMPKNIINIAITGSVSGYRSKDAFVSDLNDKLAGKAVIALNSSLNRECAYLVCDSGTSSSSKFTKALRWGTKIVTAKELEQILLDL